MCENPQCPLVDRIKWLNYRRKTPFEILAHKLLLKLQFVLSSYYIVNRYGSGRTVGLFKLMAYKIKTQPNQIEIIK